MNKRVRSTWLVLAGIAIGVAAMSLLGAQNSSSALFTPLSQIYQYVQSYFYRPDRIDDQQAVYGALRGMIEVLDDPYSEYLDPEAYEQFNQSIEGEFSGVGIEITIKDNVVTVITPLVGTPAEAAGVLAGDRILAIDGESTEGISLTEASIRIRGDAGTSVTLSVLHNDDTTEDILIVRDLITVSPLHVELLDEENVLYIQLSRFDSSVGYELEAELETYDLSSLNGLILDLRYNPGGLLSTAISVSSLFIDRGQLIVSTESRISGEQKYSSIGNTIPNIPLAVLINAGTASSAEITAGAIRDQEMGILIGSKSFGKGVVQRVFDFSDGSALKLTTAEYLTPSGQAVDGVGLTPDIEVADDEDPVEHALEWLTSHAGTRTPFSLEP